MHLSALAKELLEDNAAVRGKSPSLKGTYKPELRSRSAIGGAHEVHSSAGTPSRGRLRVARRSPPPEEDDQGQSPRVVHLSGSKRSAGGLRRAASTLERSAEMKRHREEPAQELITPAPAPRVRPRLNTRTNSETSLNGYHSRSASTSYRSGDSSVKQSQNSSTSQQSSFANQSAEDNGIATAAKTQSAQEALPNSLRVKRVPIGSGTFLRGAPVRRGIRRRQSEEDGQSPLDDDVRAIAGEQDSRQSDDRSAVSRGGSLKPKQAEVDVQDFAPGDGDRGEARASYSQQEDVEPESVASDNRKTDSVSRHSKRRSPPNAAQQEKPTGSCKEQALFRLPSLPPVTSLNDQENEPPPTFKRNRSQPSGMLGDSEKMAVHTDEKGNRMLADTHASKSPKRPVLAPLSQNTPLRPAPPPPKMSVLETATATAGASTVKSKKKRSHVIVNGKMFTVRGRLGKGGSSDVYRVMAENDKMFALKKVNLEDCNEDTVRGYRGEIELLKKLENVDRVVRLFDWEVNEQKQSLSVVSERSERLCVD